MATTDDELVKKQVQEAVWTWAGRLVVVATVWVLGFVAGFWTWGYGPQGARQLRGAIVELQGKKEELDKKRVDIDGQLTVIKGRNEQCQADLAKCGSELQKLRSGPPAQ